MYEVLNHYIVHRKLIQHCMLATLELKFKKNFLKETIKYPELPLKVVTKTLNELRENSKGQFNEIRNEVD